MVLFVELLQFIVCAAREPRAKPFFCGEFTERERKDFLEKNPIPPADVELGELFLVGVAELFTNSDSAAKLKAINDEDIRVPSTLQQFRTEPLSLALSKALGDAEDDVKSFFVNCPTEACKDFARAVAKAKGPIDWPYNKLPSTWRPDHCITRVYPGGHFAPYTSMAKKRLLKILSE